MVGSIALPGNVPERRSSRLSNADVASIAVALLGPDAAAAGLSGEPQHSVALELFALPYNRLSDGGGPSSEAAAASAEPSDAPPEGASGVGGLSPPFLAPLAALVCSALRVDLRHNDLGPRAVQAMVGGLAPEASSSGPEAPPATSDAASALDHLRELSLDGNPIGDEGALLLAAALPHMRSLQCLGLEGCRLGSKGFVAVAAALQEGACPELLELRMGDALLGGAGGSGREQDAIYRLSRAVRDGMPLLEVLSLRRLTTATAYTAATLAEHLEEHGSFSVIDLTGCRLAGEGAASLARLSVVNERLEEVGLRATGAGDEGAMAWAAAIRAGCRTAVLDLRQCRIGEEGLSELLGAVKEAAEGGSAIPARLLLWGNGWLQAPGARSALLDLVDSGIATPRAEASEHAMLIDCEPTVVDSTVEVAHAPLEG